ncbi:MAG TPA: hypothetical protein PKM88_06620 [bacterium]|nr:hypothetical protein [bacterium]
MAGSRTAFIHLRESRPGAGMAAAAVMLLRLLPGWGVLTVLLADPDRPETMPADGRWEITNDRAVLLAAGAEYAGYYAAGAARVLRVRAQGRYLIVALQNAQRALAELPGALVMANLACPELHPALTVMVSGAIGEEWDEASREVRDSVDLTIVNCPGAVEQPIVDDLIPCAFVDCAAAGAEWPLLRAWLRAKFAAR